jgi:hypothetical protein
MSAHWRALKGLTAFLDAADGDTDLEPSLGQNPYRVPAAAVGCEGGDVQEELHDEVDEGNAERSTSQRRPFGTT